MRQWQLAGQSLLLLNRSYVCVILKEIFPEMCTSFMHHCVDGAENWPWCIDRVSAGGSWGNAGLRAGVYYEQGMLNDAIQSYQEALTREPNFPEAYNNLGNALREANRMEEAMQCYTMCIQLQLRSPVSGVSGRGSQVAPQAAAFQQAQRLSVAYNNLGGILKMQVRLSERLALPCSAIPYNWASLDCEGRD